MSIKNQKGQSLIEILIGLGIISILMGSVTYSLVAVLKTSTVTEQTQTAGLVGNSLMDSAITLAEGNWNSVYNLTKGSANHYFIVNSPTTTPSVVPGDESVLSENITNGLVGHWKFDEKSGSTAYDSSGNGNIGTLYNSPTRTASTSCKVGACLGLSGSGQYLTTILSTSLQPTRITIAFWWNADSTGAYQYIFDNFNDSSAYGYTIQITPGLTGYYLSLGNVVYDKLTYFSFISGSWYHLTFTYDGTNVITYVNGIQKSSFAVSNSPNINYAGGNLNIGRRNDNNFFTKGKLDDIRIYNRALSASEVAQLYNSQVYSRYFYVDNVNRTACGTGNITTNSANVCTGSANDVQEDPSTQKITVGTYWNIKGVTNNFENFEYVTRWINSYAQQKSWSGSSGVAGAVTDFGSNFYTYSNIATTTSGSLRINGL